MTAPLPVYEVPSFDEGKQILDRRVFRSERKRRYRDTVGTNPASGGGFAQWQKSNADMVVNRSISYRGGLIVVAVPKGSSWSLTLSDVPTVRSPATAMPPSDRPAAAVGREPANRAALGAKIPLGDDGRRMMANRA
jgi:hypothetical protein